MMVDKIDRNYFLKSNPEFDDLLGRIVYELYLYTTVENLSVNELWAILKREKDMIKWAAPRIKRSILRHANGELVLPWYPDYTLEEIEEEGINLKDLYLDRCEALNIKVGNVSRLYKECNIFIHSEENENGAEENTYFVQFRDMYFVLADMAFDEKSGVFDIGNNYLSYELDDECKAIANKYENEAEYDMMFFEDLEEPYPWERHGL